MKKKKRMMLTEDIVKLISFSFLLAIYPVFLFIISNPVKASPPNKASHALENGKRTIFLEQIR